MKKGRIFIFSFLVLILGILILIFYSKTRDRVETFCYDTFNKNELLVYKEV